MMGSSRGIALVLGILALVFSGAAQAQENLDAGKTPAQLFASDCAICHKSTRGLARGGGMFDLESFLREHYTASRESAAKIAGYLRQVDRGPPPSSHRRTAHPGRREPSKAATKKSGKPGEAKTEEKKSGAPKASEKKPEEAKPAEKKPAEAKPAEPKPAETKPEEKKPARTKATDAKLPKAKAMEAEARAAKPKPSTKPSAKPDKPKEAKPAQ